MASKENQELINNIITRLRNSHDYWVGVEELRNWELKIQKAFEDSELYKKAYELSIKKINEGVEGISTCPKGRDCLYDDWIVERDCNKCWSAYLLEKARKELENEQ